MTFAFDLNVPIGILSVTAAYNAFFSFIQATPAALIQSAPAPVVDWVSRGEELSLKAALMLAVYMLWKALSKKDEALTLMTANVTKALEVSAASNAELRRIIEESVHSKEALRESIDQLGSTLRRTPCLLAGIVEDERERNKEQHKR